VVTLASGYNVEIYEPEAPYFTATDALSVALSNSTFETAWMSFLMADPECPERMDVSVGVNLDIALHPVGGICVAAWVGCGPRLVRQELSKTISMFEEELDAFRHILAEVDLNVPVKSVLIFTRLEAAQLPDDVDTRGSAVFFREDLGTLGSQLEQLMLQGSVRDERTTPTLDELRDQVKGWASVGSEPPCDTYNVPRWFWDDFKAASKVLRDWRPDTFELVKEKEAFDN